MHRILKKLDGGDLRSIGKANEVAEDLLKDPGLFPIVFDGMLCESPVIRMRAADTIEKVSSQHPEWLQPFKERLIQDVSKTRQKEVRWHVAQMLCYLNLDASDRPGVLKILKEYLDDKSKIVQVMAMQTLAEIAESDHKYRRTVLTLIEEQILTGSAAVKSRGRKLILQLSKKDTANKNETRRS